MRLCTGPPQFYSGLTGRIRLLVTQLGFLFAQAPFFLSLIPESRLSTAQRLVIPNSDSRKY